MLSRMRLLTQFLRAWHPIFLEDEIPSLPSPRSATMRKLAVDTRFPDLKMDSNFDLLSPLLGRDLVATLRSASLQSVLAIGGAHADAEPVGLAPVAVIGLVGPFHRSKSSLWGLDTGLYPSESPGLQTRAPVGRTFLSANAMEFKSPGFAARRLSPLGGTSRRWRDRCHRSTPAYPWGPSRRRPMIFSDSKKGLSLAMPSNRAR